MTRKNVTRMQVVVHLFANVRSRIKEEQTKYRLSKEIEQELVASSPWCGERYCVEDMYYGGGRVLGWDSTCVNIQSRAMP